MKGAIRGSPARCYTAVRGAKQGEQLSVLPALAANAGNCHSLDAWFCEELCDD